MSHTRSPACSERKHTSKVTTGESRHTAFPARLVLTVSFALSPVTRLFCHRRRRDAKHRRQLDTCLGVSGPHDFAVRRNRARLARRRRPSHPAPNTRDDREAPLFCGRGTAPLIALIWAFRQCQRAAADWHDGQFAHDAYARFSFWPVGQIRNHLHIFLHEKNLRRPQSLGIV